MKIDRVSFELGMINCFAEMVACGVKELALSPPFPPEDYVVIKKASDAIVEGFGIQSFLEKSLLITDLQPKEFTEGRWVILYYENDETLKKYRELKEKKQQVGNDRKACREISREFGRLLSYPEQKIEEKIRGDTTPYMLTDEEVI
jgi:hypothetical protein